jgi:hypothetical protein
MSVEDRLIILDCINTGTYNWFAYVPERLRMTTVSHLIRASEGGTATITAGGNELGGVSFQDYHLGASIDLGETNMNEVISTTGTPKVLNQHRSTGSVSYTLYFDTIMITDYLVSRIVNHPRILDTGVTLHRDEDGMRFAGAERRGWHGHNQFRSFGSPLRYIFENTGLSLGDEARAMIRMDPIPTSQMTVVFDAVTDAPTYELKDMEGAVPLQVPDQYVLPHLLPMALGELAVSPIWDGGDANMTIQKASFVMTRIKDELRMNNGSPRNRIRTRRGH